MCTHMFEYNFQFINLLNLILTKGSQIKTVLSLKILNAQRVTLFTESKIVLLLFKINILWRNT